MNISHTAGMCGREKSGAEIMEWLPISRVQQFHWANGIGLVLATYVI